MLAELPLFVRPHIMSVTVLKGSAAKRKCPQSSASSTAAKVQALEVSQAPAKLKTCAVLLMYSGWGFYGMQRCPIYPTIEGELTKALIQCRYLEDSSEESYKKIWFKYASKTDKSVSALGQVCSMLLPVEDDVARNLNEALPQNIRVLDVIRTTRAFQARHSCNHRVYDYFFPTFALSPRDKPPTHSFRLSCDQLGRANAVLQHFVGTHNFYNFTSGRSPDDKSCIRYVLSAECLPPILYEDWEYAVIRVVGQSFILHQIRKMIGLMIVILRGTVNETVFDYVFNPERICVPKAPGLGLMLNRAVYTRYNEKFGNDGLHKPIEWNNYEEEIDNFKHNYIYPVIHKTEVEERSMLSWLESVDEHTQCNPPSGQSDDRPSTPTAVDS